MKKKVLIIEDNEEFAYNIYKNVQNIGIVKIATDGVEAINMIKSFNPDIVLLDLNIPKVNGLYIIEILHYYNTDIIVMTGDIKLLNDLNIIYFKNVKQVYVKPFDLKNLCKDVEYLSNKVDNDNLLDIINMELSYFDFNKGSSSYNYLIDTIKVCQQYPEKMKNMEKELFPIVAKNNNLKSAMQVKWSLQKLISAMSRYTREDILKRYFPYSVRPSVKVFITTINSRVSSQCKKEAKIS